MALCSTPASAVGVPPDQQVQSSPAGSVGEQIHRVIQVFADLGADEEGRHRRPVPYPIESGTLADQLTVVSYDFLAAEAGRNSSVLLDHLTDRLDALRAAL